jgi:hypothetical protein
MGKLRYRVTEARIARLQKQGRGAGHGRTYQPWIKIQDLSSRGRVHRILGETTGRIHHLLSDHELDVFLMLDWSPQVHDIREQFPLPRVKTIIIAEEMGVAHPRIDGVDVVMTTDFLVDLSNGDRAAVSFKQAAERKKRRTRQKLEIERRYWASKGVEYIVLTEKDLVGDAGAHPEVVVFLRHNLLQIAEWRFLDDMDMPYPRYWADRAEALLLAFAGTDHLVLGDFLTGVERASDWCPGEAICTLKHLLAMRVFAMDLNRPLDMDGPLAQIRIADCDPRPARA